MPASRWRIVVQRERPEIYEDLRRSFELDERVEVFLDGRRGDRRTQAVPVGTERRGPERRQSLRVTESAFAQHAGFFLVVDDGVEARVTPPEGIGG